MAQQDCTRSMDCKCADCLASSAAFSINDLKKISSSVNYYDDQENDAGIANGAQPPTSSAVPKANAKRKAKATARPRPPRPAGPPPAGPASEESAAGADGAVIAKSLPPPPPEAASPACGDDTPSPTPPPDQEDRPLGTAARAMPEESQLASADAFGAVFEPSNEPPIGGDEVKVCGAAMESNERAEEASSKASGIEMAEEFPVKGGAQADGAETLSEGPLSDRLLSKDWKVRRSAYEELTKLFTGASGNDAVFAEHRAALKRMLQDANASCLDAGVEAAFEYAVHSGEAGRECAELAPLLVAKGFAGKAQTAQRSQSALLKFMEVSTTDDATAALLEGLRDKRPKVPPLCVQCMLEATKAFGASAMPIKAIRPQLNSMLAHGNSGVRAQALVFLAELIRWLGPGIFQQVVDELKPAQKNELSQLLASMKGPNGEEPPRPVPTVYLLKDRPKEGAAAGATSGQASSMSATQAVDPREFLEEVDLLKQLAANNDFATKLAEAKWNLKVEALNIALTIIGAIPKLAPGDYGDLVRQLKLLSDHSHVQVVQTTLKLLAALSEGLRGNFSMYARGTFAIMAGKLKDKKCMAVASECMDRIYGAPLALDAALLEEHLGPLLDAKKVNAVHARVMLLDWLTRCLERPTPAVDGQVLVAIANLNKASLADADPAVRAAAEAVAAAAVVASRRNGSKSVVSGVWAVVKALETGSAHAFKRINDRVSAAESCSGAVQAGGQAEGNPEAAAKAAAGRGKAAPLARSGSGTSLGSGDGGSGAESAAVSGRPGARPSAASGGIKRSGSAAPRAGARPASMKAKAGGAGGSSAAAGAAAAAAGAGGGDDDVAGGVALSPEEALERVASLGIDKWEEEVLPGLSSAKWQEKKAAFEAIAKAAGGAEAEGSFPAVVVVLSSSSKTFKDSNFNVTKAALEAASAYIAADAEGSADKRAVAAVLAPACEKLGDRKLKDTVAALLTAASEAVGPSFVCRRVLKAMADVKAPGTIAEATIWLKTCVDEFGGSTVPAAPLAAFGAVQAESTNAPLRTAAFDLLAALYHQLGPPIKSLLGDVKPAVRRALDEKFEQVGFDAAAASHSTRQVRAAAAAEAGSGGSGSGGGGGLPRNDLGALLPKDCLEKMGATADKEAWKGRKAAIEDVLAAVQRSAYYLEPNKTIGEVAKALKARLSDSQNNLRPIAAEALAAISRSVPPEVAVKIVRTVAGEALLLCVADNRKQMKDAAIASLETIVTAGGSDTVQLIMAATVSPLEAALMRPLGRLELIHWLNKHVTTLHKTDGVEKLVPPLVDALKDKTSEVRQAAEECLTMILAAGLATPSTVRDGMRDFAPAQTRTMQPSIERIVKAAASGGGASSSAAASTTEAAEPAKPAAAVSRKAGASGTGKRSGTAAAAAHSISASLGATGSSAASKASAESDNKGGPGTGKALSSKDRRGSGGSLEDETDGSGDEGVGEKRRSGGSNGSGGGGGSVGSRSAEGGGASNDACGLLLKGDKAKRMALDSRTRWFVVPEEPRNDQWNALRQQWTPLLTPAAAAALFPAKAGPGMEAATEGLLLLKAVAAAGHIEALAQHLDLVCKWLSLRMCDKENVQALQAMVDTMQELFNLLLEAEYKLEDYEADVLLPTILAMSGQSKERFQTAFRGLMAAVAELYKGPRYITMVLSTVANSKSIRTRFACTTELGRLIEAWGVNAVGKKAIRDVAKLVDTSDLREPALKALEAVFLANGASLPKLHKDIGTLSEKAKTLVDERMKTVLKRRPASGDLQATNSASAAAAGDTLDSTAGAGAAGLGTTRRDRQPEGARGHARAATLAAVASPSAHKRTSTAGGRLSASRVHNKRGEDLSTRASLDGAVFNLGAESGENDAMLLEDLPREIAENPFQLHVPDGEDIEEELAAETAALSRVRALDFGGLGADGGAANAAIGAFEPGLAGEKSGAGRAVGEANWQSSAGIAAKAPEVIPQAYEELTAAVNTLLEHETGVDPETLIYQRAFNAVLNVQTMLKGDMDGASSQGISDVVDSLVKCASATTTPETFTIPAAKYDVIRLPSAASAAMAVLPARHAKWLGQTELRALFSGVSRIYADCGAEWNEVPAEPATPTAAAEEEAAAAEESSQAEQLVHTSGTLQNEFCEVLTGLVKCPQAAEVMAALLELLQKAFGAPADGLRPSEVKTLTRLLSTAVDSKVPSFPEPFPLMVPLHELLAQEGPVDLDSGGDTLPMTTSSEPFSDTIAVSKRLFAKLLRRRGEDAVVSAMASAGLPLTSPLLELLGNEEAHMLALEAISAASAAADISLRRVDLDRSYASGTSTAAQDEQTLLNSKISVAAFELTQLTEAALRKEDGAVERLAMHGLQYPGEEALIRERVGPQIWELVEDQKANFQLKAARTGASDYDPTNAQRQRDLSALRGISHQYINGNRSGDDSFASNGGYAQRHKPPSHCSSHSGSSTEAALSTASAVAFASTGGSLNASGGGGGGARSSGAVASTNTGNYRATRSLHISEIKSALNKGSRAAQAQVSPRGAAAAAANGGGVANGTVLTLADIATRLGRPMPQPQFRG